MRRDKEEPKTPENELSYEIIEAAIEAHKILGSPGLLEGIRVVKNL